MKHEGCLVDFVSGLSIFIRTGNPLFFKESCQIWSELLQFIESESNGFGGMNPPNPSTISGLRVGLLPFRIGLLPFALPLPVSPFVGIGPLRHLMACLPFGGLGEGGGWWCRSRGAT